MFSAQPHGLPPARRPGRGLLTIAAALITCACNPCAAYRHPPPPVLSAMAQPRSLRVGALERTYSLYRPANLQAGAPLVVALHGAEQTGEGMRANLHGALDELADRFGFAVVYPDGFEKHWDDCRTASTYSTRQQHIDDTGFISALLDREVAGLRSDPARVFALGFSNGGQMVYRLALELPERFRAVAVSAASLPTADNFDCAVRAKSIPILIQNGDADSDTPPGGGLVYAGPGAHSTIRSSLASAQWFADRAGLREPPLVELLPGQRSPQEVERTTWGRGARTEVVLEIIRGGGHQLASPRTAPIRVFGRIDRAYDGLGEIWAFFARQPREAP